MVKKILSKFDFCGFARRYVLVEEIFCTYGGREVVNDTNCVCYGKYWKLQQEMWRWLRGDRFAQFSFAGLDSATVMWSWREGIRLRIVKLTDLNRSELWEH